MSIQATPTPKGKGISKASPINPEFLFPALKGMLPDGHQRDEVARRPPPAPPAVQHQQKLLGIRLRGGLGLLAG
jgi:hypothetical protein